MAASSPIRAVLLSTYELGRQPFGLASPAAWLREANVEVMCTDLAVEQLNEDAIRAADLIAFYLPMHTATRLALRHFDRVRWLNPSAHICFYGLYASMNESYLRRLGAQSILGGEFEERLVAIANLVREQGRGVQQDPDEPVISVARQRFLTPDRSGLPPLERYAKLQVGHETRVVGYTEASRGCRHLCRHCPIVPVYGGRFRIVQRDVVLEDVRAQVAAGARHITFGDPDFFNGPSHSIAIVTALHEEFPELTYDVTIKIEHLRKNRELLPVLRDTGCLFVISAVEAIDDITLTALDKQHTRDDFVAVVKDFRDVGLNLTPTFVTFSPWTTLASYAELLATIEALDLIDHVAPIQYAIRLLIPAGSRLLELPDIQRIIGPFDEKALVYPWEHPDPRVDALHQTVLQAVGEATTKDESRRAVFSDVWELTHRAVAASFRQSREGAPVLAAGPEPGAAVPHLTEPWYCCAEPTEDQLLLAPSEPGKSV